MRPWAVGAIAVVLLLSLPATALAVFPGENGRIAFISGIGGPPNDDADADLFVIDGIGGSFAAGDARTGLAGQHRHPNWSPDGRRIAFALWNGAADQDIWIYNVATGNSVRLGGGTPNITDDRPAWSPDGTKIAYESEFTDGSGLQEVLIYNLKTGRTRNLTKNTWWDGKPVWSPDGRFIYYSMGFVNPPTENIYRLRANGADQFPTPIVNDGIVQEYQPALSPNGKRMCFTRGPYGTANADVYTVNSDGSGMQEDVSDTALGAYNCAYSPDGTSIIYVEGTFTSGRLMYAAADGSGIPAPAATDTPQHFDGNPDWARVPEKCRRSPAGVIGTARADRPLLGFPVSDVIQALAGRDRVWAKGGKDKVCGEAGNDTLRGGRGKDTLIGGRGRDILIGGRGNDRCRGGPGRDVLRSC